MKTEAPKTVRLFLSCVSDEFHRGDPQKSRQFESYRDSLARNLREAKVQVIVQEDLVQGFDDLLHTLDDEVAQSTVIVHLVGEMAGTNPTGDEVRRLRQRHPNLFVSEPTLQCRLNEHLPISYTQWELYLAWHHQANRLVFFATPSTPRAPGFNCSPDQAQSQARHRKLIETLGAHRSEFVSAEQLCRNVLRSLLRHALTPIATARPADGSTESTADADLHDLVKQVAARINSEGRGSSTENFLHSLKAVAKPVGLTLQRLIQTLDKHTEKRRAEVAQRRTPGSLQDLAFALLSIGDFEEALQMAAEAAELAERNTRGDPNQALEQREAAINSWLLVKEAAVACHRPDQALEAMQKGGNLIDKVREPVFWADFHQPLAKVLLDMGRHAEAEPLIREIIALYEDELGDHHPKLAPALLLLGMMLLEIENPTGAEVVAERVLRIEEAQPLEARLSTTSALTLLGMALSTQERYDEAEPLLRQARSIVEHQNGPDSPEMAFVLNGLALLLQNTERLAESETLMRRAVRICKQTFLSRDPKSAIFLTNLAGIMTDRGDVSEAERLHRQACERWLLTMGSGVPPSDSITEYALFQKQTFGLSNDIIDRNLIALYQQFDLPFSDHRGKVVAELEDVDRLQAQLQHNQNKIKRYQDQISWMDEWLKKLQESSKKAEELGRKLEEFNRKQGQSPQERLAEAQRLQEEHAKILNERTQLEESKKEFDAEQKRLGGE